MSFGIDKLMDLPYQGEQLFDLEGEDSICCKLRVFFFYPPNLPASFKEV
jgi:hypothetical protein